MNKEHFTRKSHDGATDLHVILWKPDTEVKAVLQLVHGMAEYIDRYHDFAAFLTEHGFAVIGHDHLGHGQSVTSPDKLGFFAEKNGDVIVVDDMHLVTEEAMKRCPGLPVFILGHSMGSFMVRKYLTRFSTPLSGAIIMGTGFIPKALASAGQTTAKLTCSVKGGMSRSKLLTGMALGQNNKPFAPNRTAVDWLSRNDENVDRYVADPLCGFMFTSAAYKDFFTVLKQLAEHKDFDKIRKDLPVLITSGELDPVGGTEACRKVEAELKETGLTDVTLKLYPGDRHEILNELDRDQVFSDILGWLESKL